MTGLLPTLTCEARSGARDGLAPWQSRGVCGAPAVAYVADAASPLVMRLCRDCAVWLAEVASCHEQTPIPEEATS